MSETNQVTFELEGSLTIAEVGSVYARLNELLDSEGGISLQAEKLEQLDGAGLQLLAAFSREMASRRRPLSWIGATGDLLKSAQMVGLTDTLGLGRPAN